MRSILNSTLRTVLLLASGVVAQAFSLLGPFDASYQVAELNYNSTFTSIGNPGDLGGPMNVGEEYRVGGPVLVYGFDSTFVEFFGPAGVAAVESAVAILNNLPLTSQMSPTLSEYPLSTIRFNNVAQQLRLLDVKSVALSTLVQQMGLAAPERWAWTLHDRLPIPNTDPVQYEYFVIQRNFDPVSWKYSSYVNNTLYSYQIVHWRTPTDISDCQEVGVNVANPNVSVAAMAGVQAGAVDPRVYQQIYGPLRGVLGSFGMFYSGLTRDDVGGLRYLYRTGNTNWQAAPLGSTGGGGGGGTSPWDIVGFQIVNPLPGSPWNVVGGGIFGFTNGTGVVTGAAPIDGGRGGPGKVALVRVDTDPLLGQYLVPVTIRYPETVINSQGTPVRTVTSRTITQPDILFTAADLGRYANLAQPYVYRTTGMTYLQVLNPGAGTAVTAGPGIIEPGVEIALNKVGPWLYNVFDTGQGSGIQGFTWGSFDGSTNAPIAYPQGATLEQLESKLFGQQ
ncbi:MAG: hypothetical protein JNL10_10820 [Verrucomicrobiales bacterium]|nr:hypothetical protein [Verrucomicrobiales bacterium]